ncbi:S9 family peptidase [Paraburkholderia sp. BCC1885]|uniref:S9 family peptidase n=1 Tax=Paraburkholderia sp. BCC1885 TaxID=2562669 RepID=UPI001181FE6C|nr:prolyl oligopeptidase family serine peptidase [Paraburkholderia sp. BCC1885]
MNSTPSASSSQSAPFGSWKSPVTAQLVVGESLRLGQPRIGSEGVYWTEGRPQEKGRHAVVRYRADGEVEELTVAPFDAASRVHEYGGGSLAVTSAGVFFVNFKDQQVYTLDPAGQPKAVTQTEGLRFADLLADPAHGRLIGVCEDHRENSHEPANTLVSIDLGTGAITVIASGHDFYASPSMSPDGTRLAWLTWDHPNMPWDGTELWIAEIAADGALGTPHRVAGGVAESLFQPAWSPAGDLYVVSDRSGWWNLYRVQHAGADVDNLAVLEPLQPMDAEFGKPQWIFGMTTYGFAADGRIVCLYEQDGITHLAGLDPSSGAFADIATPYTTLRDLQVSGARAVFVGSSPTAGEAIVELDLPTQNCRVLRYSDRAEVDARYVSIAEPIRFPTEGGLHAHAFFYPPANPDFAGPAGTLPPLIVIAHGGPTSSTHSGFRWPIQFWTSRGFAVVDVDYGGSSGHGRAYRQRLDGQWGITDVNDAINAARYLIGQGRVNKEAIAVRGGSAGGYLVLCGLAFHDFFKAGASYYGVGDLEALIKDTHKFESRYLIRLVGPYPEEQALYRARSPIHFVEQMSSAMILFQGSEDKVVPPNQAESIYQVVRAKGLPVAHVLYEGEGHGFKRADTITHSLEAELYFYGKIFGFEPADKIEPVEIENI